MDVSFLFSHKSKQDDDAEVWKIKHARLTEMSGSTPTGVDVTALSGANDLLKEALLDTYSNNPANIKFSNIRLSRDVFTATSTLVMEPDECQVFSSTRDIRADGIGAVLAMRSSLGDGGDESGKWNVIYLKEDKAESGSST